MATTGRPDDARIGEIDDGQIPGEALLEPRLDRVTELEPPSFAPAGWYDDPERPGVFRYWDGTTWTDHRAPGHQQRAGWYDDPERPGVLRYWDGTTWTDHRAPGQQQPAAATGPSAVLMIVIAGVWCVIGLLALGSCMEVMDKGL